MFDLSKGKNVTGKAEAMIQQAKQQDAGQTDELETTLSIPDSWNYTEEERYVYSFYNNQSPKLKVNQLSIYGMELIENSDDEILITGLVRSTVTTDISLTKTIILLLDHNQKLIARKEFNLSELGTIPPNSARPWKFTFGKKDFISPLKNKEEWTLAFDISVHKLDLDESWKKAIDQKTKKALEQIVAEAPPLKSDELNVTGIKANINEEGNLIVTALIRNGHFRDISIEQFPLTVRDGDQDEVAQGSFKLENFTVKANTSKPWTFIFPPSMVNKPNPNFSRWAVYVKQ